MPERVFQSCNEERARSGGRAGGGRVNWNLVLKNLEVHRVHKVIRRGREKI